MSEYDVVVIGAGPSGLACGIEAVRRGLRTLVIDKGSVAESIRRFPVHMTFFSTPELLEIGGIPFPCSSTRPSRVDALSYYLRAAEYAQVPLRLHSAVQAVRADDSGFVVALEGQPDVQAANVIIATGYYDNPRMLGVSGETLPHVMHYYDEPYRYSGTNVAVVGAGNSAVEAALELFRGGSHVTMIHRGKNLSKNVKYWVVPDISNRLEKGEVEKCFHSVVEEIKPGSLVVKDCGSGEESSVAADFVFVLLGYVPDTTLISSTGVEVDADTLVPTHDPQTFETNVKGLYVAGSVTSGASTGTIFIENGREHAAPILNHITGSA